MINHLVKKVCVHNQPFEGLHRSIHKSITPSIARTCSKRVKEVLDPKPYTRKLKTRNPKPENPKVEFGNPKSQIRNPKPEN